MKLPVNGNSFQYWRAQFVVSRKAAVVQGCNLPRATKQPSIFRKTTTSNIFKKRKKTEEPTIWFLQLNPRPNNFEFLRSGSNRLSRSRFLNSLITSLHRNPRRRNRVFIFMECFIIAIINVYIPDWSSARSSKTCNAITWNFIDLQGSAGNLNERYNKLGIL